MKICNRGLSICDWEDCSWGLLMIDDIGGISLSSPSTTFHIILKLSIPPVFNMLWGKQTVILTLFFNWHFQFVRVDNNKKHTARKSYRNIAGKGVFRQTNQCPHPVRVQNPKGVGWSGILDTQMSASRFHELLNTYAPCRCYFSHILLWHCPSSPTTLWETYQSLCLSLWLPKVFQDLVYTWTKAKGGGGGGGGLRGIIGSVLW